MSDTLPPLPHPVGHIDIGEDSEDVFTADQMREYALAARQQAQVPDGWKPVPPEATQAMHDAYSRVLSVGSELDGAMVWAAMLAAAPHAAQPEQGDSNA